MLFTELLIQGGYLLKDHTQLYLTTGAANGPFHFLQSYKFTSQANTTIFNNTKSLWGFDIGIGIKEELTKHLALNVDVQNIKFQNISLNEVHGHALDKIQYSLYLLFGKIGLEYRF